MTDKIKDGALEILSVGIAKIIRNYTDYALLINACHKASDYYRDLQRDMILSTIVNIPLPLRLDDEFDVRYRKEELVDKYVTDQLTVIFQNYIITIISTVDAILEDLYEHFLKSFNPLITDLDLEKQIRHAWTNDNLLRYLTDPHNLNLQQPRHLQMEYAEAFMRYSELRIIRHTLLHTNGKLSDKNYQKLQANLAATPEARKHFALANAPFIDANRDIKLNVSHILSTREYLDRFLMYIFRSIEQV